MRVSRRLSTSVKVGLTFCFTTLFASVHAYANPVNLGTFYEFQFAGAGSPATACDVNICLPTVDPVANFAGNEPYTFTLTGPGTFTVQDLFAGGDQFAVYDGTTLLGDTSAASTSASCGNDITVCSMTAGISKGTFALGAGPHSIDITAIASPSGGGAAVFEASSAVTPEPSGMLLLGTGLLGIAGVLRRRGALFTH